MGIESFKTAPDSKGGRPPKSESQEDGKNRGRIIYGDPTLPAKGEREWRDAIETLGIEHIEENLYDGDTIGSDHIGELSNYAHLFPWGVRVFLELHGIYETDWWSAPDHYPSESMMVMLLEDRGVKNDFTRQNVTSSSDEKASGGLTQLIEDAKDSQ